MSIEPQGPSKPSGMYLVVAVLVLVAGVGIFAYLTYSGVSGVANVATEGMFTVPGEKTIKLEETGAYLLMHQTEGVTNGTVQASSAELDQLTLKVTSSTGEDVPVTAPSAEVTTQASGTSAESLAQFTIDQPGDYTISAAYPEGVDGPEAMLMVLPLSAAIGMVGKMGGGMAVCCVSVVIALVIVIVYFVKRSKASRASAMYPPPGMTPPGGAPPAQY